MSPSRLRNDPGLKVLLEWHIRGIITFVPDWNDTMTELYFQRMYLKSKQATMAADNVVTTTILYLTRRDVLHRISQSHDFQKVASSRADLLPARDSNVISTLNHELREPT